MPTLRFETLLPMISAMSSVLLELDTIGPAPAVFIKDTLDVAGVPTRAGSPALAEAPAAAADATAVARLRAAGWRIAGKTKLHELAFGTTGINLHDGTPVNPRWPDRVPGGSSSGSAVAVAAGLAPLAIGTDTGGSVRVPACCCGVIGLKPTFGLVDRQGTLPAQTSLDCIGPFARDMATIVAAMQALAPGFEPVTAPAGFRVGLLACEATDTVREAFESAFATWSVDTVAVSAPSFKAAYDAGLSIINRETFAATGHLLATGRVGPDVAVRLRAAGRTDDAAIAQAEAVRRVFAAELDALFEQATVLALPTMPDVPPRIAAAADTSAAVGMTALVRPFNLSGHPAISLPLLTREGLPAGLQLVARRGADALLCAVASLAFAALEA